MTANNFSPSVTKLLTSGAASVSVTLDPKDVANATAVRIYNAGPLTAFVRWGVGAQTALATDMPLVPGVVEVFGIGLGTNTFAAISPGGAATISITCGGGQ